MSDTTPPPDTPDSDGDGDGDGDGDEFTATKSVSTKIIVAAAIAAFLIVGGIAYAATSTGDDSSSSDESADATGGAVIPDYVELPIIEPDDVTTEDAESVTIIRQPEGDEPLSADQVDSLIDSGQTDRPVDDQAPEPATVAVVRPPVVDEDPETGLRPLHDLEVLPLDEATGTVPIPEEPGPIPPGRDADDGSAEPVDSDDPESLFHFPFHVESDVLVATAARMIDRCAGGSAGEDCPTGTPGSIVPIDLDGFSIADISRDLNRYCDGQLDDVARDRYAIAILSNQPGTFDVVSIPQPSAEPVDEVTVTTPDDVEAAWRDDPFPLVPTCVELRRRADDGDATEVVEYRVEVTGTAPAASPPPTMNTTVVIHPTGRPEVRIVPTGDRTYSVTVPARDDESVIVVEVPFEGTALVGHEIQDRCSLMDPADWNWNPSLDTRALEPVGTIPRIGGALDGLLDIDRAYDTNWLYASSLPRGGDPSALCIFWFETFEPTPRISERQSYTLTPPTRPTVTVNVASMTPTDGTATSGWDWRPDTGVHLEAWRAASGEQICDGDWAEGDAVTQGQCAFDLLESDGELIPFALSGRLENAETTEEALGPARVGVLDFRDVRCGRTTCLARYAVPIFGVGEGEPGPSGRLASPVLGQAMVDTLVTNTGEFGTEWSVHPTGPFVLEDEEPPPHGQLNTETSSLELVEGLEATSIRLNWEADRPVTARMAVHASESWTEFCPVRAANGDSAPAVTGTIVVEATCPGMTYDANVILTDETGTSSTYGQGPRVAGYQYTWPEAQIRTEAVPIEVDFRMATRAAYQPDDWGEVIEESEYEGNDLADVPQKFVMFPGYTHRERRSSSGGLFGVIGACGNITDYDLGSDEPIALSAGPVIEIEFETEVVYWETCNVVGGARDGVITRGTFGGRSGRVNTWDFLRAETHELLGSRHCFYYRGGCDIADTGWAGADPSLTTRLDVTARLADSAYESMLE